MVDEKQKKTLRSSTQGENASTQGVSDLGPAAQGAEASGQVRVIGSDEILRGERTVLIRHGAEFYRLILTRNGKLILQK